MKRKGKRVQIANRGMLNLFPNRDTNDTNDINDINDTTTFLLNTILFKG